jgi:mannose-6-phosphate isomerase-like protein (cupin superfamily)
MRFGTFARFAWSGFAGFMMFAAPAMAQSRAVTHMDSEKVAEALAKGGSIVATKDFTVAGTHRNGPGQVEIHDHETDILYITEGQATFVTGGTIVGGKQTAPGQTRGTDIKGGQTTTLKKGDVVTIPAGVPHWFKDVPSMISYLTIKVIK